MEEKDAYAELSSIRDLMERSSKFISLSGWAGVLSGVFALLGAGATYLLIHSDPVCETQILGPLVSIAVGVLLLSMITSYWLTMRKARSRKENAWNPVSKRMLVAVGIPMVTGGLAMLILFTHREYSLIAPISLIFYGLGLVAASQYTYMEVKWLGIGEVILGLIALLLPQHGLLLWAIGFGVLHILYGIIMYYQHEK